MEQEFENFATLAVVEIFGLDPGFFEGDDDLAQEDPTIGKSVAVGKGENVGCFISVSVFSIDPANLLIVSEENVKLRISAIQSIHRSVEGGSDNPGNWASWTSPEEDLDGTHADFESPFGRLKSKPGYSIR